MPSWSLSCRIRYKRQVVRFRAVKRDSIVPHPPIRSYMICTLPRSGSTMLCRLLAATKIAGAPGSLFHDPSLEEWFAYYGVEPNDYPSRREALNAVFTAAIACGRGGTDVFGLRMQRGSFDHFMEQVGVLHPGKGSDIERIEAAFGPTLYIHLTRADRLDQAISRLRAEQTGLWHRRADGTELERLTPRREDRYDPEGIAGYMKELSDLDAAWEHWFEREALAPLRITYEELSDDPRPVLESILGALGLDVSAAGSVEPQTAKLADATSRAWRARFEAERGAI